MSLSPHDLAGQQIMADEMGISVQEIQRRVNSLSEHNPMLGHRGCRLGNTYPEITVMQTRAILSAAIQLKKEGYDPQPEIMVPLIGIVNEFDEQEKVIRDTALQLFAEEGVELHFRVGTMIEIPRAALTADQIARHAEYFSFGTNDLTQMTFGYSRDDIASFLPVYLDKKIPERRPLPGARPRRCGPAHSVWPSNVDAAHAPTCPVVSAANTVAILTR